MSTALMQPNGSGLPTAIPLIYNQYRYDQLNRITQQISYTGASTTDYNALSSSGDYTNLFVYDAAGNIQKQFRNGESGAGQSMDSLTYHYYTSGGGNYKANADGSVPVTGTNKLNFVDDNGTSGNYDDDLEDQSADNYVYDQIGNLTEDASEGIEEIVWNVYGKIDSIKRVTGWSVPGSSPAEYPADLKFIYDAFGNRIVKIVKPRDVSGIKVQDEWIYTYYMRDAAGNVMSTYTRTYTEVSIDVVDKLQLKETHLYGSSRLGMKDRESEAIFSDVTRTYSTISIYKKYNVTGVTATTAMAMPDLDTPERTLGNKQYEFGNHLGNVLVTLSDRKFAKQQGMSANVDYFTADIRSYSDYSAFGSAMVGRTASSASYRYSFNGKETDAETDLQDYGFRIYNPALGKFLSVDPLTKDYPHYTPYQFAGNKPIWAIDLDGLEEFYVTDYFNAAGQLYKTEIQLVSNYGMSAGVQTVHRSAVNYQVTGNALVTYQGWTRGSYSPAAIPANPLVPGAPGPFSSVAEGQRVLYPTPIILPDGNIQSSGIGEWSISSSGNLNGGIPCAPHYYTCTSTPDPNDPNNPYAPGITPISGTFQNAGNFQVITVPGVAGPNPATSAYVAPGTNAVPQDPNLRVNGAGVVENGGNLNGPAMGAATAGAPPQIFWVPTEGAQQAANSTVNGPPAPVTNTVTIF